MSSVPFEFPADVYCRQPFVRALLGVLERIFRRIAEICIWIKGKSKEHINSRRLRLIETVSFGEKRFIAVLQIDGQEYLVGGGATGVALLTRLDQATSFSDVLNRVPDPQKPHSRRRVRKVEGTVEGSM
jgi:flagellar biogenesis protein FliO